MAEQGKLYITISDERGNGTPGVSNGTKKDNDVQKENLLSRYIEHEAFHIVKQQTMKAVDFSLGNIGNFTGDYITQQKINDMRSNLSSLMAIGMTTLAGAKYGVVGAVIGFSVGAISQVSSGIYETIEKTTANKKQNYEIAQIRDRAGLNSVLDGSRGTEN